MRKQLESFGKTPDGTIDLADIRQQTINDSKGGIDNPDFDHNKRCLSETAPPDRKDLRSTETEPIKSNNQKSGEPDGPRKQELFYRNREPFSASHSRAQGRSRGGPPTSKDATSNYQLNEVRSTPD